MTPVTAFRRYWWVSLLAIVVGSIAALVVETQSPTEFRATGTIMVAAPEVDPARAESRSLNLSQVVVAASESAVREQIAADGGRSDYRILQVSESRAQVLASGDASIPAVRAVLRVMADEVAAQQIAAQVGQGELIRPRLFVQIPEDRLEALASVQGQVAAEPPEAIGTLVLEDPLAGSANALGGPPRATRLVLLRVTSDAGRQELTEELPDTTTFDLRSLDRRARNILTVSTTSTDADNALDGFDIVSKAVSDELERRQELANVPREARLIVDILASPLEARNTSVGWRTGTLIALGCAVAIAIFGPGLVVALEPVVRSGQPSYAHDVIEAPIDGPTPAHDKELGPAARP